MGVPREEATTIECWIRQRTHRVDILRESHHVALCEIILDDGPKQECRYAVVGITEDGDRAYSLGFDCPEKIDEDTMVKFVSLTTAERQYAHAVAAMRTLEC